MNTCHRQRGLTVVSIVALLGVLAFFVLIALTLAPVYMENFSVNSHLDRLVNDASIADKTKDEIRNTLMKRFSIDNVDDVAREDIIITENETGYEVEVDYEVRKHILGNIDVVVFFNEKVNIVR
ncbi:MAG: DUF4845 domain-containing protein [Gammaproteobacteria bacterium]|nr:DUF4845 domain-containing protein [Gammaproteobacteria bacterium]